MDPEELKKKLEDALNQVAVEQLRADEAETKLKEHQGRADKAEGELRIAQANVTKLEKERTDHASEDVPSLKRKIEVLQGQVGREKTRADNATSSENLQKLVAARSALQSDASFVLGDSIRADELSKLTDTEVMLRVLERLDDNPAELKDKSPDYLRACYDSAVKHHRAGHAAMARVGELTEAQRTKSQAARSDNRSAREKFLDAQDNLWRQPATEKGAGQ